MKRLILAFLLGVGVPAGSVAATGLAEDIPRVYSPLVVDADGRIVGRYTYSANTYSVPVALFEDGGTLTALTLGTVARSSDLTFRITSKLYHTTTDCTGATYIGTDEVGVRPGAVVLEGGKYQFYLADRNRAERGLRMLSTGDAADCQADDEVLSDLYETSSPPLDLTARFRLPLHVR
jgi:hypothetical protein